MSIIWYDKKMNPLNADDFLKKLHSESESESFDGSSAKSYQPDSDDEEYDDEEETGSDQIEVSENESDETKEEVEESDCDGKKSNEFMEDDGDLVAKDCSREDTNRGKKSGSGGTRKRRRCPLIYCKSKVVHLPRHLQDVHGWPRIHARTALVRYGMRKTYAFSHPKKAPKKKKQSEEEASKSKESKDYHYHRYCPLQGCTALVKRLPPHLRKVHKLSPDEVKKALSKAVGKRVRDSHRVPIHERRLQYRNTFQDESDQPSVSEHCSQIVPCIVLSDTMSEEESNENEDTLETVSGNVHAHEVLKNFKAWLQSADGGQLDAKTTEQHYKQLLKLLSIIDEKMEVSSLYDDQVINEKFLEGYAKKQYHPKTTQSYLMSLRHFYSFFLTTDLGESTTKEKVIVLKEKVARWSTSFRRSSAKRHWEKMEEDFNALISPEQIKEFERSKAARDAICLLGKLTGAQNMDISQSQYTLLRDFLIVEIAIDNANRSGALANMKMGEFKKMKTEGDDSVILVKDHKTMSTHGPARIVLSQKLSRWLQIFVTEVRPRVSGATNDNDRHVFLSWNGERLASSQISKAMKSVWKKAEIDGTIHTTILRKSAVSGVHSTTDSSETHSDLADLMAHNVGTARHYYKLNEKSKSSVKASRQLRCVMRGEKQQRESDPDGLLVVSTPEECQSKKSKVSWSPTKVTLVQAVFEAEIAQQSVSLETVKSKISSLPELQNVSPKRVLDKVRSQWRYEKEITTEPLDLPSEQETVEQRVQRILDDPDNISDVIPPTVTSSMKNVFTSTELEKVRNTFKEMIVKSAPISKPRIKETLEKESWGKDMLEKVSVETIVNRIKYERRVHRSLKKV